MTIPVFLPRHLASLVTCCVTFCCGCCFCDCGTVVPLGSSCAVSMSRMMFGRFRSTWRGHRLLGTWPEVTWSWICVCSSGGGTAPGFGDWVRLCSNILTHSTFQDAMVSPQAAAVEHVCLAPSRGSPLVSLPFDCKPVPGVGGNTGSYSFVCITWTTVFWMRCSGGRMVAAA